MITSPPTARQEFLAGLKAELPIAVGGIPFGLIYGVLALASGLPPLMALAMSPIVFAGSAQFIGVQLIGAGTPGLVIVLTAFVVNLRHALYSTSLAPQMKHLPRRWQLLLAYLLTDEAYAMTIIRYLQDRHDEWPRRRRQCGPPLGRLRHHGPQDEQQSQQLEQQRLKLDGDARWTHGLHYAHHATQSSSQLVQ